jgi:hypothetical protein
MIPTADFPQLCESFFTKRLMAQRKASQHTISSYAHTFRLLLKFAHKRLGRPPSKLSLAELDASFLAEFSDDLEATRSNDARISDCLGAPWITSLNQNLKPFFV